MTILLDYYADFQLDLVALDVDIDFIDRLLATAHENATKPEVALHADLGGYKKYSFAHPKTNESCRYVFGYRVWQGKEFFTPVWISERRKMGPKYEKVKARLGISSEDDHSPRT